MKKLILGVATLMAVCFTSCEEEDMSMYHINFDTNGGTNIECQIVEKGDTVSIPETPTKDNTFFMYWMLNDSTYDFSSKVENDIILTAKWQANWQATSIIGFEDILLDESGLEQNDQTSGSILSEIAALSCAWTTSEWGTYGSGFSISNHNDTETAGYGNPYSCIAGSGAYESTNFAVNYGTGDSIKFEETINMESVMLCNNTYAYLSMRDGDSFAKKFNNEDEDYFKLTLHLHDEDGTEIGSEDFFLADFRGNASYIVNTWTKLSLTGYNNISYIKFSFESTDVSSSNSYNTPSYFCIDNIEYTK